MLVALISDTGMRLSEAAGLHIDDIKLDADFYLDLLHALNHICYPSPHDNNGDGLKIVLPSSKER